MHFMQELLQAIPDGFTKNTGPFLLYSKVMESEKFTSTWLIRPDGGNPEGNEAHLERIDVIGFAGSVYSRSIRIWIEDEPVGLSVSLSCSTPENQELQSLTLQTNCLVTEEWDFLHSPVSALLVSCIEEDEECRLLVYDRLTKDLSYGAIYQGFTKFAGEGLDSITLKRVNNLQQEEGLEEAILPALLEAKISNYKESKISTNVFERVCTQYLDSGLNKIDDREREKIESLVEKYVQLQLQQTFVERPDLIISSIEEDDLVNYLTFLTLVYIDVDEILRNYNDSSRANSIFREALKVGLWTDQTEFQKGNERLFVISSANDDLAEIAGQGPELKMEVRFDDNSIVSSVLKYGETCIHDELQVGFRNYGERIRLLIGDCEELVRLGEIDLPTMVDQEVLLRCLLADNIEEWEQLFNHFQ